MSDASPQVDTSAAPSVVAPAPPQGDWRASLSEDLRGSKSLERYADVGSLAKGYVELEKRLGSGGTMVPGKDAKPEEWDAFHTKLGLRPDAWDKYELAEVPGLQFDATLREGIGKWAHKHGVSQAAYKELTDFYAGHLLKAMDSATAKEESDTRNAALSLEKVWGPRGGPRFRTELAKANKVNEKFFGDNERLHEAIRSEGNKNPAMVEALAAMAPYVLESHELVQGEPAASPDATLARVRAIFNDKTHPFNNPGSEAHEAAKRQVQEMYEQVYGRQPVTPQSFSR